MRIEKTHHEQKGFRVFFPNKFNRLRRIIGVDMARFQEFKTMRSGGSLIVSKMPLTKISGLIAGPAKVSAHRHELRRVQRRRRIIRDPRFMRIAAREN